MADIKQGSSLQPVGQNQPPAPLPFSPVSGSADSSDAVFGDTASGTGVRGLAGTGTGVSGESNFGGIGVLGYSQRGPALVAQSDATGVGLLALGNYHSGPSDAGIGSPLSFDGGTLAASVLDLIKANPGFAAVLSGKVTVTDLLQAASVAVRGALTAASATVTGTLIANTATVSGTLAAAAISGDIIANSATLTGALTATAAVLSGPVTATDVVLSGADCAEDFDIEDDRLQPGAVAVFTDTGGLACATAPYDRRAAGVISGAGPYRPGVLLDRRADRSGRAPLALVGKVYCNVDAGFGPVAVGDLLTTSPNPGHAMRAADQGRSFGAVIGKALAAQAHGVGQIPILVIRQ